MATRVVRARFGSHSLSLGPPSADPVRPPAPPQALVPLANTFPTGQTPDLRTLVDSHRTLSHPPPPSALSDAAFSIPTLFAAIQELEDSVMTLRLEVEEASKLQHGLESELELRALPSSSVLRTPRASQWELIRSLATQG